MAEIVRMPKLSDTMTEGVVAEWHKKVGDQVASGDILAEIETDKATMDFESFQDGTLLHIGVNKGEAAPVNCVLAVIGEKGEDIAALLEAEDSKSAEAEAPADAKVKAPAPAAKPAAAPPAPKPAAPKAQPAVAKAQPAVAPGADEARVKASPLARKLAAEKGISLTMVRGTGDHGRVVKRDIENFGPAAVFTGIERYTEEPVSQMRKTIARRLGESKFTAPHFYLTLDIDMDRAMDARKSINEIAAAKISFNDMVVKAVALALRDHPNVNSAWMGDVIRRNEHVHIGVAVAVDEGLLVPVIRFADGKTLSQISSETRTLAKKARNKELQPSEWEGNTFTISNLGMFGIEEFTAIINPPDACIMAVGGIRQIPVVKNGQIVPGNRMKVTLSCDHRVVDGVTGAQFLATFRKLMENPVVMLGQMSI